MIVGQEVATAEGPLVGLFLHEDVPAGLALAERPPRSTPRAAW